MRIQIRNEELPPTPVLVQRKVGLLRTLIERGQVPTLSQGRRLIYQGMVTVDGVVITDPHAELQLHPTKTVISVGKTP